VTFPFGPAFTICCPDAIHRDHGRGNRDIRRSYEVEGSGVLKIRPKDRSELISLSPAFWRQINEPRSSYDMLDSAYGAER
jgi:hypothetical protein